MTGDFAAERDRAAVTLSNGRVGVRSVLQHRLSARAQERRRHADGRRFTPGEPPAVRKICRCRGGRKIALSGDVFNLFNVGAATGFLSADARSSNFGVRTNYVPARVGQLGLRLTF